MDGKPKIGQRMIRSFFVGNLIGLLMFIVAYMAMVSLNAIGSTTIMQPVYFGIIGWITGLSASLGIEFSKDLE